MKHDSAPDLAALALAGKRLADTWDQKLSFWLAAALEDPDVSPEMKEAIESVFDKISAFRAAEKGTQDD